MMRQYVKDYKIIENIPEGNYRFGGGSCAPKGLIFHVIDDPKRRIKILDIGFGLGQLGEIIKSNSTTSHWEIDGIDGYEVACFNSELFKRNYYRNIWHGFAQELSIDQLKNYDVICLLDVIEHLPIETSKWLIRTLLSSLREDSYLFISTPLWFYPQDHKNEGDLEEHLIGVPASSMMALQPTMYAFGINLVGGFVYKRSSLDFVEFFQPTADKSFSMERGIKVATAVGMKLDENVLIRTTSFEPKPDEMPPQSEVANSNDQENSQKLTNLVQIINGCGGAETIEECAYLPMQLGATIIVVDAYWPQYLYPNGDPNYAKTSDLITPDYRIEDLASICKRNNWHYLKMDKFAFNGEQYNYALDFIRANNIPCDHVYFVDSDECLDPMYVDILITHINECKKNGLFQLRFKNTIEILPGWKSLVIDERVGGNYGILWGDAIGVKREEFFDGNFHFQQPVPFGITNIPLYHLHHFRKNAISRINDGSFTTGGKKYDIQNAPDMQETVYVQRLKCIYENNFTTGNFKENDSYLGDVIFCSKR